MKKLLLTLLLAKGCLAFGQQEKTVVDNKAKRWNPDSSIIAPNILFHTTENQYKVASFNWYNSSRIMTISAPDTSGKITVVFDRKKVHFINDSTFTFKIPK